VISRRRRGVGAFGVPARRSSRLWMLGVLALMAEMALFRRNQMGLIN
jgi:hypothetical protein